MAIPIYQVDAFAQHLFSGNPAAVVPVDIWPEDRILLNIANENNLSETAFYKPNTKDDSTYDLRWFTPKVEVGLCGHATLATAHIIFTEMNQVHTPLKFNTRSGLLSVGRISVGKYLMDLPSDHGYKVEEKLPFESVINTDIKELYKGKDDYLAILSSENQISQIKPDFAALSKISSRGLIISSRGNQADFVSRGFFPNVGINEDPATGSAHTLLTPYWAMVLKKNRLKAIQLSQRVGYFDCTYRVDRTTLVGNAITYMRGEIAV